MDNSINFRASPVIEPQTIGMGSNILHTPLGNVRTSLSQPPPLPPAPMSDQYGYNPNQSFMGGPPTYGGGFGTYGGGYGLSGGNYGYSNFGGNYGGLFGGGYNGYNSYNRFGGGGSYLNPYDPESQFIQLAEQNSRPAFESIESLVSAVANIASMLDSTFFAITSSFRAILGVAANFGRLRGVFTQFWQTFAILRGLTWIYKKLLYWLRISNIDPSSAVFKEAFEAAQMEATNSGNMEMPYKPKSQSPWPVIVFLSFIFTAPYLVMKLLGNLTSSALVESKDPKRWVKPIKSVALYDFRGRNPSELTVKTGQNIFIAPKEIQNTQKLLNTGWALATIDGVSSGLIPITYVKRVELGYEKIMPEQTPATTDVTNIFPSESSPLIENSELKIGDEILFSNDSTKEVINNTEGLTVDN